MINFYNEAKMIKNEIIDLRRKLHSNPELGFEEFETSKFIKKFLRENNISFKVFAKTGVCGIITGEIIGNNKVVALRADMDALPLEEKNSCDYASNVIGKMHACGHDAHVSILLGTAKILNKYKGAFSGTIKLIFEPAEETVGGALFMIEEGVLQNPNVDAMIGLHVDETINSGTIMIKDDIVNAASNPFSIKITGAGGHGAYPHLAIDSILIASNIILLSQSIISREISPLSSAVITFGSINAGSASNIIPEEVFITGIIRTLGNREFVLERFKTIIDGICTSMRAVADIEIEYSYPCLLNNSNIVSLVKNSAVDILGRENVLVQEYPKMGVESFAYFANKVDSAFYFVGTKNESKNIIYPAHSPRFNIDEDILPSAVAIQCLSAFNYLTK